MKVNELVTYKFQPNFSLKILVQSIVSNVKKVYCCISGMGDIEIFALSAQLSRAENFFPIVIHI